MAMRLPAAVLSCALALAACNSGSPEPEALETEVPEELAKGTARDTANDSETIGTPMADRVATIGLLNKRNNVSRDFELKPGEATRVGDVVIRLEACEKTAPWELPQEEGAFVQVFVRERKGNEPEPSWNKVFSGWLFRNSPSLNVVEHPVYDVWVKQCAMSFPGEEESAGED
ncbi:MAG: DUF2155 domain-containing protein [Erythrobacter sp.]|nr:DUF2155 domain-containing protein [Erythrobacter sp.]NCQ63295.1 DUF2155 domain-containing protein [Alphaproteobacteria bacterium]